MPCIEHDSIYLAHVGQPFHFYGNYIFVLAVEFSIFVSCIRNIDLVNFVVYVVHLYI